MPRPRPRRCWTASGSAAARSTSQKRACRGLTAQDWVSLWSIPPSVCTPSPETSARTHRNTSTSWSTANSTMRARQKWQREEPLMKTMTAAVMAAMMMKKGRSQKFDLCPVTRRHWSPCSRQCASARLCIPTPRMRTRTTTLKERNTTWKKPRQSTVTLTSRASTPATRVCRRSRRRARPHWRGWRGCWPSQWLSSTTWLESEPRKLRPSLKMAWRWMQQRWRPVSLTMLTWSTDGNHLCSQSQQQCCIVGLKTRTAALV